MDENKGQEDSWGPMGLGMGILLLYLGRHDIGRWLERAMFAIGRAIEAFLRAIAWPAAGCFVVFVGYQLYQGHKAAVNAERDKRLEAEALVRQISYEATKWHENHDDERDRADRLAAVVEGLEKKLKDLTATPESKAADAVALAASALIKAETGSGW